MYYSKGSNKKKEDLIKSQQFLTENVLNLEDHPKALKELEEIAKEAAEHQKNLKVEQGIFEKEKRKIEQTVQVKEDHLEELIQKYSEIENEIEATTRAKATIVAKYDVSISDVSNKLGHLKNYTRKIEEDSMALYISHY